MLLMGGGRKTDVRRRTSNVANAICDFACDVDAGTVRVPCYRWSDPPLAGCCCDFVGLSLVARSQRGLKLIGSM